MYSSLAFANLFPMYLYIIRKIYKHAILWQSGLPLSFLNTQHNNWAREYQKNIYFCVIDYAKAFDCVNDNKLWKILRDGNTRPPDLPPKKSACRSGNKS